MADQETCVHVWEEVITRETHDEPMTCSIVCVKCDMELT